ncbi:fluoride efflux transporter FluC [Arthrobacter mobilis]|uniref:Fluoride-specific ion channel FluC n=1 Tax=Arthrobacter mobilis TaxID=2724944 RepID=A0A7X6HGC7_9MICC|nr:CrcB family protein [Arthrobacter mobilis]NKX55653.1 CrcB family protein [Arthrobacter mobilis]
MSPRPHLHPGLVLLVALGGAAGTLARYGLNTAVPARDGWPLATLIVNLAGAFLLGLLLEVLVRAGNETSRLRMVRLGLGTGVLGGFTTFSTFALEVEQLLAGGSAAVAAGYFAASLLGGVLACLAGVAFAGRRRQIRSGNGPRDGNGR